MKLVYSSNRFNQASVVHRFDVLGDLFPSDLDVIKNALFIFNEQLHKSAAEISIVILDISESKIKINENKLQLFFNELKNHALASQVQLTVAQSDIESMLAEQRAIEQSLLKQIDLLQNKLDLMISVKNKIELIQNENSQIQEKLNQLKPKHQARSFFEKLWGES